MSTKSAIQQIIDQLTLDEKASLVHGALDPDGPGQAGFIPGVARLGIPPVRLVDGPAGIHVDGTATAFPAPIALASAFDPDLAARVGAALATEARAAGQHVVLAPMANLIRVPQAGRNFESFSEDPLLTSRLVEAQVRGIQDAGAIACVKHLVANNQERDRRVLDVRAAEFQLDETEYPAFRAAVEAGVGTVMAAYNKVNGTWATEHHGLLTDTLRTRWGFNGFVISDWSATHSAAALPAGLDLEMPLGKHFDSLPALISTGEIASEALDLAVERILSTLERFGMLDAGSSPPPSVDADEHEALALEVAERGAVLLKNTGALPLTADATFAVIGAPGLMPIVGGGGSSEIHARVVTNPLDELRNRAMHPVAFAPGIELEGTPIPDSRLTAQLPIDGLDLGFSEVRSIRVIVAVPTSGRYIFEVQAPRSITVLRIDGQFVTRGSRSAASRGDIELTAGEHELSLELEAIRSTDTVRIRWVTPERLGAARQHAVAIAASVDTAIVLAFDQGTEGADRSSLDLPFGQNELISAVARVARKVVVVLYTGGAIRMPWLHEVESVLLMHYPGGMGGRATARLVTGEAAPSGRLTQSFPIAIDLSALSGAPQQYPGVAREVRYTGADSIGYLWHHANGVQPLFGFGHGLTYGAVDHREFWLSKSGEQEIAHVQLENRSAHDLSEIVQVYLDDGHRIRLAGFRSVFVPAQSTTTAVVPVDVLPSDCDPLCIVWTGTASSRVVVAVL